MEQKYFDYYSVPACIWEDESKKICYCGFYDVESGLYQAGGDIIKVMMDGIEITPVDARVFAAVPMNSI